MRNVTATVLQLICLVGLVTAGWLWCLPAGVAATAAALGVVGYVVDPTR
jgi:hypothetical protein